MRVCHLVHHLAHGGLEQQVYELIRHGAEDVDYTVCYLDEDDSLAADIRAVGGTVRDLDVGNGGRRAVVDPRAIRRVAAFLQNGAFDLLHVHSPLYVHVIGRLASAVSGPAHVVGTYHNQRDNFHTTMRVLERVTRPLSSVNVGVSQSVERSFSGRAKLYEPGETANRTCTIYNGIDIAAFAERVESADTRSLSAQFDIDDDLVFLNVGRYSTQKSQDDLIRAMANVVDVIPNVQLFIVGWGPREQEMRRLVRARNLEGHVSITGKVSSVEKYYAAADVFTLSSMWEGLPIALLEAMAAGLPVIATDVSGVREVVQEGETGRLVSPDSPDEFATEMVEMASGPDREEYGMNGYQRAVKWFDIKRTSELYLSLYLSLLENG